MCCGGFLRAFFAFVGGVLRLGGGSAVGSVVACRRRLGAVVRRSALARSGVGAVLLRRGRGRRVPLGLGGCCVCCGLGGLGRLPAGGSPVRGSGLRCLGAGGRPALAAVVGGSGAARAGALGWFGFLVVPALSLFPAAAAPVVVGFSGGRRLSPVFRPLVAGAVSAVLAAGRSVAVGCASGADSFVRVAAPAAVVFSAASFGVGRASFARRSVALVRFVASGGPGSGFVVFPSAPCPPALAPSACSSACFCGSGSGSWASAALAAGLGLPLVVFPCGFSALPPWGVWVPAGSGCWASGFLLRR